MLELELTYLAKRLPENLGSFPSKEIIDIYFPATRAHPVSRIRKSGDKYSLTKKTPVRDGDFSAFEEQTVELDREEYDSLSKIDGKRLAKIRYYCALPEGHAEVDVFQEQLAGLVLVDFEFDTDEKKAAFRQPDFCLADVTQDGAIAGGILAGKSYADIESDLDRYGYQKIS